MYFKRPSFRKGGTIGGGIMAGTDMGSRTGFQTVKPAFVNMGGANPTKPNFVLRGSSYVPRSNLPAVIPTAPTGIVSLMSRFPKTSYLGGAVLGTGIGLLTDAYQKSTKTPLAYKKLKEVSSRPYYFDETNIDVGEGLDEIRAADEIGVAPGFFPRGGKDKFFEDRGLDAKTGLPIIKDKYGEEAGFLSNAGPKQVNITEVIEEKETNKNDDQPKEKTFDSIYEEEKSKLEKLLGDDDDKGMAAIALSEAIGTPGTIADKAAVLNKSLLSIMAGKKKDKKDIAKLAYTATKEIEKAKIAAGKEGFSEKQFNRMRELKRIIGDTTGTYNEAQKKAAQGELDITTEVIKTIGGKKDQGLSAVDSKLLENLDNLATKLSRIKDKDSDSYRKTYNQYLRARQVVLKNPNLRDIVALADAQVTGALQMENGGRVKKQLGGSAMEVSETVGQGETPTAQVQQLSFSELRNRLPKEITDDVIRLLSNSNEALQDFAYIRTQGDVSKFNTKYGVTLVLPAQTA